MTVPSNDNEEVNKIEPPKANEPADTPGMEGDKGSEDNKRTSEKKETDVNAKNNRTLPYADDKGDNAKETKIVSNDTEEEQIREWRLLWAECVATEEKKRKKTRDETKRKDVKKSPTNQPKSKNVPAKATSASGKKPLVKIASGALNVAEQILRKCMKPSEVGTDNIANEEEKKNLKQDLRAIHARCEVAVGKMIGQKAKNGVPDTNEPAGTAEADDGNAKNNVPPSDKSAANDAQEIKIIQPKAEIDERVPKTNEPAGVETTKSDKKEPDDEYEPDNPFW